MPTMTVGCCKHRCEDREREHLFITDQHCGALVIDRENARSVETKWDAHFAERPPHSDRNRHTLVECGRFRTDQKHRVVDALREWLIALGPWIVRVLPVLLRTSIAAPKSYVRRSFSLSRSFLRFRFVR